MVRRLRGATPSLSISHAIVTAPTCAHGLDIRRSRISSTTRSMSSGVLAACVRGARDRPAAQASLEFPLRSLMIVATLRDVSATI